ncbi:uncharacterized protein LOC107885817 [Acyrthosiphon pisum]|uniref:Uncharacterized protein n=1 Tax=Acyrthosiphon pisum TaxID=7029 RepID=A0A8R2HC10_ACYPI|nr:uncharacterized protein LOC107885817 [Acyrthosiphon pisum]|eukprot:XP_016665001.1 PREDICTED: uncharacterized protein LOC107885817 [Acyrthosiphon pisum]
MVILVVSRFDTNKFISTTFYEIKISRWHYGPEMITNRKNAGLAVVKDNLVFAVGGSTDMFHQLRSVDVLDLSAESPCWRSSVEMFVKRNNVGVGVINNYLYADRLGWTLRSLPLERLLMLVALYLQPPLLTLVLKFVSICLPL